MHKIEDNSTKLDSCKSDDRRVLIARSKQESKQDTAKPSLPRVLEKRSTAFLCLLLVINNCKVGIELV